MGPTADTELVREALLAAYATPTLATPAAAGDKPSGSAEGGGGGGWVVCGYSVVLYDTTTSALVPACEANARLKYNALTLCRAVVQQLFIQKPKPVWV